MEIDLTVEQNNLLEQQIIQFKEENQFLREIVENRIKGVEKENSLLRAEGERRRIRLEGVEEENALLRADGEMKSTRLINVENLLQNLMHKFEEQGREFQILKASLLDSDSDHTS